MIITEYGATFLACAIFADWVFNPNKKDAPDNLVPKG